MTKDHERRGVFVRAMNTLVILSKIHACRAPAIGAQRIIDDGV
jgi:hypothetical protein